MTASDWASVVSAAVAVLGLGLAAYQTRQVRHARRSAEVRIAELTGSVAAALAQTRTAADSADALVQRAKANAPAQEIQNLARVLRGQLTATSTQLARQAGRRDRWTVGAANRSAPPGPPVGSP